MKCPFCKKDNDRVVDSRVIGEGRSIRRRRKCLTCDKRFTTYERIEAAPRLVGKQDQRREHFNRDKILQGLRFACKKRPISEEQLESIASRVEAEVFEKYDNEVSTRSVGEHVSEILKDIDQVAYVRFASVYREFTDVEQFHQTVEPLRRSQSDSVSPALAEQKDEVLG